MLPSRVLFVLGLLVLATGCDRKPPPGPSGPPPPAVTTLAITGADAVLTGLSASYTATAASSDRSTRTVAPEWTSSNPGVATVDGAGRLDGRAHGSTSLTATFEGRSVSKTVQVVNNYGGTWVGRYVIRACRDTGDLVDHDGGYCLSGSGRVGSLQSITMTLVQSGNTLSEIAGTYSYACGTITGVVSADGRLNLGGTVTWWDENDRPCETLLLDTLRLGPWNTNLVGTDAMTGHWSSLHTFLGFRTGTAHTENEFVSMTRVPTSVRPASAMQ